MYKLFFQYLKINFLTETEYRVNFFIQFFQSILNLGTGLAGILIVYSHTDTLNGWTVNELMALLGIFYIMGGIIQFVIEPSMQQLMEDVRLGTLDYVLTKPQDSQLIVSIRQIRIFKLVDIAMGCAVLIFSFTRLKSDIADLNFFSFGLSIFSGVLIVYSFWLILATFSIWFVRIDNLLFVFQSIYQAGRWPVDIYPAWMKTILTYLIPVAFATTIPAKSLSGQIPNEYLLITLGVCFTFLAASRIFWRQALRFYSGASS